MDISTEFIGMVAGIISFLAWMLYAVDIIRKKTRPNRATWATLTLLGLMVLLSYYELGARDTIWVPIGYFVGPLVISLLSIFYYGEGGWTSFDKKCIFLIAVSFILWLIFRIYYPLLALPVLIVSLFIDFIGLLPTFKKSLIEPEFENANAWSLEGISSIINLFAVGTWSLTATSFSVWVYPVYLVVVNLSLAIILVLGKFKNKKTYNG